MSKLKPPASPIPPSRQQEIFKPEAMRRMTRSEVPKRLIYKRAVFARGTANLQEMLDRAIVRFPAALDREFRRADDASLMLNTTRPNLGQCTCGVIVRFTRGNNTAIMGLDPKARELPVAQLHSPPLNGNKQTEFIENLGYFALQANEIIVVQSIAVRAASIQDYLNWFLRDRAGLMPENDSISLQDVASEKFRQHQIASVRAFDFNVRLQTEASRVDKMSTAVTVMPTGPEFLGLRKLLEGVGIQLEPIPLDPREAEAIKLSVRVEVSRRSFDEQSALLNALGEMANARLHDESFQIEFDNGLRLSGEDLFISKVHRFTGVGGITDPFDIFKQMAEYLNALKTDPRLKI